MELILTLDPHQDKNEVKHPEACRFDSIKDATIFIDGLIYALEVEDYGNFSLQHEGTQVALVYFDTEFTIGIMRTYSKTKQKGALSVKLVLAPRIGTDGGYGT